MIKILDNLYVGNSDDVHHVESGGLLNVSRDLKGIKYWPKVEYMQIGLIDGPGNEISDYCGVVLCIKALLRRHNSLVVYDHDGTIAFAVVMMYLNLIEGQCRPNSIAWSRWLTYQEKVTQVCSKLEIEQPSIKKDHIEAFNKIKWSLLEVL